MLCRIVTFFWLSLWEKFHKWTFLIGISIIQRVKCWMCSLTYFKSVLPPVAIPANAKWRALGSLLQQSDSQSAQPAHVFAGKPRLNNTIDCEFGTRQKKTINSAHIFRGTIYCQINHKYNPTYCLVLQLGIDPWCSATVQVFTASLKPPWDRFPNRGMETRLRVSKIKYLWLFHIKRRIHLWGLAADWYYHSCAIAG